MNTEHFELETHVVAALFRDNNLWNIAELYGLTEDSFSYPQTRDVFNVIAEPLKQGRGFDLVMLQDVRPEMVETVLEWELATPTTALFSRWAQSMKNAEALRKIIADSQKAIREARKPGADAGAVCAAMAADAEAARMMSMGNEETRLKDAARHVLQNLIETPPEIIPFFPGNTEAARQMLVHKGELWILGAKTGVGKTEFAVGAAVEQLKAGLNVVYFCTESSTEEIFARFAAAVSGVRHFIPRRTEDNILRFGNAVREIVQKYGDRLSIVGNERGAITPARIRGTLRKLETDGGRIADVVFVDFIQNMRPNVRHRTELEEMNSIVQDVHDLLLEYRACGFVLSQFHRLAPQEQTAKPDLSFLKNTSTLEQLAHGVLFLHKPNPEVNETLLFSGKTRNCGRITVNLRWKAGRYISADAVTGEYEN